MLNVNGLSLSLKMEFLVGLRLSHGSIPTHLIVLTVMLTPTGWYACHWFSGSELDSWITVSGVLRVREALSLSLHRKGMLMILIGNRSLGKESLMA